MSELTNNQWSEEDARQALKAFKRTHLRRFNKTKTEGEEWVPYVSEYVSWSEGREVPKLHDLFCIYGDWGTAWLDEFGISIMGGRARKLFVEALYSLREAKKHFGERPVYRPEYEKWVEEASDPRLVTWAVIRRYFGTWVNACEAVGMNPGRQQKLQGMEDEILRVVRETCSTGALSVRQFNAQRAPGVPRAERIALLFGGWPNSLKEAGCLS
jgi:hypothetical protein